MSASPRPPAQVQPYVEVLGVDLTVEFLLTFGGGTVCISKSPRQNSELARLIGVEKVKELASRDHMLQARVPLAKRWTAKVLFAKGESINKIARRLHVTDVTVRDYLSSNRL